MSDSNDNTKKRKKRGRNLPDGPTLLSDILKKRGWDVRDGQVQMVEMVSDSIDYCEDISISAPVGIGKSLGCLTATLPDDRRLIIATSTLALQDQYVNSELPDLRRDLKDLYDYDLTYEVIKGKSNYVCMKSLDKVISGDLDDDEMDLFEDLDLSSIQSLDPNLLTNLRAGILEKMKRSRGWTDDDGKYHAPEPGVSLDSTEELRLIPDHKIRKAITTHSCLSHGGKWWEEDKSSSGQDDHDVYLDEEEIKRKPLPHNDIVKTRTCPLGLAYIKSLKADVVVMNTSLLVAEMQKHDMFPGVEYLPSQVRENSLYVVDEAHHLPSIITNSMSQSVDSDQLIENINTLMGRIGKRRPDRLSSIQSQMKEIISNYRGSLNEAFEIMGQEKFREGDLREAIQTAFRDLQFAMERFCQLYSNETVTDQRDSLSELGLKSIRSTVRRISIDVIEPLTTAAPKLLARSEYEASNGEVNKDWSYRVSISGGSEDENGNRIPLQIHLVPMDLTFFRPLLDEVSQIPNVYKRNAHNPHVSEKGVERSSLVLCSGTLSHEVGMTIGINALDWMDEDEEDFDPDDPTPYYYRVKSPFSTKHMRLFLPKGADVPNPQDREAWLQYVIDRSVESIRAVGGRTMVLCTSNRTVSEVADALEQAFPSNTIYRQNGGLTRGDMLSGFAADESSILVGTKGFWEGVNIPGDALCQVIIDKIPFPIQDDPTIMARREYLERTGVKGFQAFMRVDVDLASVDLEQGRGRAQRSVTDICGVMILDPRIEGKNYGQNLLAQFEADLLKTNDFEDYLEWMNWVNPEHRDLDNFPSEQGWSPVRVNKRKRRFNRN